MNSISKRLIAIPLCAALAGFSGLARAGDIEEAMEYYDSGRYALAVDRFQAAAVAGDARAQEILAFMYALGSEMYPGVTRDMRAASHWFDLAAKNGRSVSRYMACAMRREETAAKVGSLCFERVAEVGKPGPR